MLRKLNLLIPAFLKHLDRQLLLNRPGIWATKIHFVVFYGLIGLILMGLKAQLQSVTTFDVPDPDLMLLILSFPTLLAIGFWSWQMNLFSVERTHGQLETGSSTKNQLIFAMGLFLLTIIPLSYVSTLGEKVKLVESRSQFISDVNAFNIGEKYLQEEYQYWHWIYAREALDDAEVEQIQQNTRSRTGKLLHIQAYLHTLEKYGAHISDAVSAEQILFHHKKGGTLDLDFREKNKAYANMRLIERAQNDRFVYQQAEMKHLIVYLMFFIWMSMLIFHKIQWKHFLMTVVLGVAGIMAGGLFTFLVEEFLYIHDEAPTCMLFIGTLIFLLIQTYRSRNTQRLKIWKSISLSLATLMTPFVPLVMVGMVDNSMSQDTVFNLMYIGLLLGVVTWNIAYNRRFVELQSMPSAN